MPTRLDFDPSNPVIAMRPRLRGGRLRDEPIHLSRLRHRQEAGLLRFARNDENDFFMSQSQDSLVSVASLRDLTSSHIVLEHFPINRKML